MRRTTEGILPAHRNLQSLRLVSSGTLHCCSLEPQRLSITLRIHQGKNTAQDTKLSSQEPQRGLPGQLCYCCGSPETRLRPNDSLPERDNHRQVLGVTCHSAIQVRSTGSSARPRSTGVLRIFKYKFGRRVTSILTQASSRQRNALRVESRTPGISQ